jgi:hypothetical protein
VITLEGIIKEKREERKFIKEIFIVKWWGGGVMRELFQIRIY